MSRREQRKKLPGGFSRYWDAYGGVKALLSSKYLWTAGLCTILTAPIWTKEPWWEAPLSVLPNLLGFTLGGYALLVSFGDDKFKAFLIDTPVEKTTAFMTVSATFIHFILVQASALLVALLARAFYTLPHEWIVALGNEMQEPRPYAQELVLQISVFAWWAFGFFLFLYSITSIVAVGMAIFEVTGWFNDYRVMELSEDVDKENASPRSSNGDADSATVAPDAKRARAATTTTPPL